MTDLVALQQLLDQSIERAGRFLRSSFQMPQHSMSAGQLVTLLKSSVTVAVATVGRDGAPRVAPIGAWFRDARFVIPTLRTSARARHLAVNPAISLTYYEGVDIAVIVHGRALLIGVDHPDFTALEEMQVDLTGGRVREWGGPEDGLYIRVEPDVVYTYARHPEGLPEH